MLSLLFSRVPNVVSSNLTLELDWLWIGIEISFKSKPAGLFFTKTLDINILVLRAGVGIGWSLIQSINLHWILEILSKQ